MTNPVGYIEKYPERTIRILGNSYQEWQKLTEIAIAHHQKQQEKLESSKIRLNAKGVGRKPNLTPNLNYLPIQLRIRVKKVQRFLSLAQFDIKNIWFLMLKSWMERE